MADTTPTQAPNENPSYYPFMLFCWQWVHDPDTGWDLVKTIDYCGNSVPEELARHFRG